MTGEPSSFVVALLEDLEARLDDLDRERAAIKGALRALRAGGPRAKVDLSRQVVDALVANPGSRATMIALDFGIPVSQVHHELAVLEARGSVEKAGLGWRVRPRVVIPTRNP